MSADKDILTCEYDACFNTYVVEDSDAKEPSRFCSEECETEHLENEDEDFDDGFDEDDDEDDDNEELDADILGDDDDN